MEDTVEVAATVYRRLDSGVCFAQTKRGEGIFIASRMATLVNAQPGDRLVLVVRENVPERKHMTPYVAVAVEPVDQGPRPEVAAAPELSERTPEPEPEPELELEPAEDSDEVFKQRIKAALFMPINAHRVWTGRAMYEELTGEEFSYKLYSDDKARLRRINMCYTIMLALSEQKKLYCCRIGYNERRASYLAFARGISALLPCGVEESCAQDTVPV